MQLKLPDHSGLCASLCRASTLSVKKFLPLGIATAVAGAIIGINAFNQPDVEASKIATRELTEAYEKLVLCQLKNRSLKQTASSFF